MIGALLSVIVAQAGVPPPDLVVLPIVRPRAITVELAESNAEAIRAALISEGYLALTATERQTRLGGQDPAACQSNLTCFALLGRSLGTPILVRVEAGAVETDLAIFLQGLRSTDGSIVAEETVISRTDATDEALRTDLAPFLAELRAAWPPPTRLKSPDLTVNAVPTPTPAGLAGTDLRGSAPAVRKPLWPLGASAAGVVVAGVGVVFLTNAGATHQKLTAEHSGPPIFTGQQGQELKQQGELQQSLGWALAGVGVAAVATGAALYFVGSADAAHVSVRAGPSGVLAQGAF